MIKKTHFFLPKRFSLLKTYAITFFVFSIVVRVCLYFHSIQFLDFSFINFIKIFAIGLCYDIGSMSYFLALYTIYLLATPIKFHGSKLDKIITKRFPIAIEYPWNWYQTQ